MIGLNLAGMVLFFGAGWFFLWMAFLLAPQDFQRGTVTLDLSSLFLVLLVLLILIVVVIVMHESVHGLFFWIFTRQRPIFGFKGWYAYAAAPGWYLPRNQFLLVGIAPLLLLSLLGLVLLPVVPPLFGLLLLVGMTMNVAGAVGDLFVVVWLLTKPATFLVRDVGEAMTVYGPIKSSKAEL